MTRIETVSSQLRDVYAQCQNKFNAVPDFDRKARTDIKREFESRILHLRIELENALDDAVRFSALQREEKERGYSALIDTLDSESSNSPTMKINYARKMQA